MLNSCSTHFNGTGAVFYSRFFFFSQTGCVPVAGVERGGAEPQEGALCPGLNDSQAAHRHPQGEQKTRMSTP
jgi:hypothetical protein